MGYWIVSVALIAFGIAGMMTIGQPFVLVGLAMVVLGPLRRRPLLFWPPLLAVIAYNLAFWAISPLYCSATSLAGGPAGPTTCSSLFGIGWPTTANGLADPASVLDLTTRIALLVAAATFVIVLGSMLWRRRAARRA